MPSLPPPDEHDEHEKRRVYKGRCLLEESFAIGKNNDAESINKQTYDGDYSMIDTSNAVFDHAEYHAAVITKYNSSYLRSHLRSTPYY